MPIVLRVIIWGLLAVASALSGGLAIARNNSDEKEPPKPAPPTEEKK